MSWFDSVVKTTKLYPVETLAINNIQRWCKKTFPSFKNKFQLDQSLNKGYFNETSWALINSFADLRTTNAETIKLQQSNYRLQFPSFESTSYLTVLGLAQRAIKTANPHITESLAITMCQLTWGEPGKIVPEHRDTDIGYMLSYRVHIPVMGVASVFLRSMNHTLRTEVGTAYFLNNRIPHSYVNEGDDYNIFFTLDFIERSKMPQFPDNAFWSKMFPVEDTEPEQVKVISVDLDSVGAQRTLRDEHWYNEVKNGR